MDENESENDDDSSDDERHQNLKDKFRFKFDNNDPYAPYRFEGGSSETSSMVQTTSILRSPNKNFGNSLPKKSVRFEIENVDSESAKSEVEHPAENSFSEEEYYRPRS